MKTPREILLNQHRDADGRLDAIRQEVVRGMSRRSHEEIQREAADLGILATCWQEMFVSCRRYWAGLGVAWALVLFFFTAGAFSTRHGGDATPANTDESLVHAVHAQLERRNELLGLVVREEASVVSPNPGPQSAVLSEERYV